MFLLVCWSFAVRTWCCARVVPPAPSAAREAAGGHSSKCPYITAGLALCFCPDFGRKRCWCNTDPLAFHVVVTLGQSGLVPFWGFQHQGLYLDIYLSVALFSSLGPSFLQTSYRGAWGQVRPECPLAFPSSVLSSCTASVPETQLTRAPSSAALVSFCILKQGLPCGAVSPRRTVWRRALNRGSKRRRAQGSSLRLELGSVISAALRLPVWLLERNGW